jgi:hypothetical protein
MLLQMDRSYVKFGLAATETEGANSIPSEPMKAALRKISSTRRLLESRSVGRGTLLVSGIMVYRSPSNLILTNKRWGPDGTHLVRAGQGDRSAGERGPVIHSLLTGSDSCG